MLVSTSVSTGLGLPYPYPDAARVSGSGRPRRDKKALKGPVWTLVSSGFPTLPLPGCGTDIGCRIDLKDQNRS